MVIKSNKGRRDDRFDRLYEMSPLYISSLRLRSVPRQFTLSFLFFSTEDALSPVSLSLAVQRGANVDNTIRSRERRGQIPGRIPGDWNTKEGDSAARGSSLLGSSLWWR